MDMPYPSSFPSPQSSAREAPWRSPTQSLAALARETGEGEGEAAEVEEVRAAGKATAEQLKQKATAAGLTAAGQDSRQILLSQLQW